MGLPNLHIGYGWEDDKFEITVDEYVCEKINGDEDCWWEERGKITIKLDERWANAKEWIEEKIKEIIDHYEKAYLFDTCRITYLALQPFAVATAIYEYFKNKCFIKHIEIDLALDA